MAELTALVPAFEAAFLGDMADWTLPGKRRQARRYTTSTNGPLPTPEERLWFIFVSLKQHPTPQLHGRVFGRRQSKATPWMHVVWPVLRQTLGIWGEAPCRRVETWRQRLGVEWLLPSGASAASEEVQAAPPAATPLVVRTAPSDPSRAPKTRLNRTLVIAARTSGTCAKTSF